MKKIIFSTMVAIVAVGGALAGNASTPKFTSPAKAAGTPGPCNTTVNCFTSPTSPICTLAGVTYTGPSTDGQCTARLGLNP